MTEHVPDRPEYVGSEGPEAEGARPRRGHRRAVVPSAAGVAVLAAVAAGAYGLLQLLAGGGSSPASAVPADAIGYVSLDLDPSAGQKIEAIKIIRKFPALKKQVRLGSRDDLRRAIVEEIRKDGDCRALDYDRDVKPWVGDRIAIAAVPGAKHRVVPLVTIQVSDRDRARAAVRKLEDCDRSDGLGRATGVAFSGDYLLLTPRQSDADAMAESATSAPLADDSTFKTWLGRAGDPGIITMYASPRAGDALVDAQRADLTRTDGGAGHLFGDQLAHLTKRFDGAAAVVRFHDGAVEAELADKGLGGLGSLAGVEGTDTASAAGEATGPDVRTLPGSTAALLSLSLPHGWLDAYVAQLKSLLGHRAFDQMVSQAERQTGLDLPEDVRELLGDGVSVSVDSTVDLQKLADSPDPADVPVGIRIKGDPATITRVLAKLKAAAGPQADLVRVSDNGRDLVGVGTDGAYVHKLLQKGDLGSTRAFEDAVPEADKATSVVFVAFDAGNGWSEKLADLLSDDDRDLRANVAPLDALGIGAWTDGAGVQHSLLRLTTD